MKKLRYMRCGPITTTKADGTKTIEYVGTKETISIIKAGRKKAKKHEAN